MKEFKADIENRYPSANGKDGIVYYIWLPDTPPRGFVQIIHGMMEHSGRYAHFARFLTANGFGTAIHDSIGHGKSASDNAALGRMEPDSDLIMVQDAFSLTGIIKKEYKDIPVFLLGHSMGSFVGRLYCAKYGNELAGALFSGTGSGGPKIDFAMTLTKFLSVFKGDGASGRFVGGINGRMNSKLFPGRTGNEWLAREETVWNEYRDDPLCGFEFSFGAYKTLFKLMKTANDKSWFKAYPNNLPTFLFSGMDDPVGDRGTGVHKVYMGLIDSGNGHVYVKLYEGGRHEMLNETNKEEVYQDILRFITHGECLLKYR